MADSDQTKESKSGAPPGPDSDLKSATGSDPEDQETFQNISKTGSSADQEDQNKKSREIKNNSEKSREIEEKEKEENNINNQTTTIPTTSSQHEASIKPDKEGISKELSQNNVDADTTTTKNNNKSTENIVQEEKSCETEEKDEYKKSESDLSDISSKNPEIIVEAADNEEKKGLYFVHMTFIYLLNFFVKLTHLLKITCQCWLPTVLW